MTKSLYGREKSSRKRDETCCSDSPISIIDFNDHLIYFVLIVEPGWYKEINCFYIPEFDRAKWNIYSKKFNWHKMNY